MAATGRRALLVSIAGVLCLAAACGGGDGLDTSSTGLTEPTPMTTSPATTGIDTSPAGYDREAFCAAWAAVREGSEVPADQGLAAVRRVALLGPPSIASDLQLWADYFERVMPLVNELRQDPSPTSERRAELEAEIESMSAPIRDPMARVQSVVESECPGTSSSDPGVTSSSVAVVSPCENAVEVARWPLASRQVIVLATDSEFCLYEDRTGQPGPARLPLAALRNRWKVSSPSAPTWLGAGSDSTFGTTYWLAVPDGFPAFTVRTSAGTLLPSARTATGYVLVYDPGAPQVPSGPTASTFRLPIVTLDLISADGATLAQLTSPGPSGSTAPTTTA